MDIEELEKQLGLSDNKDKNEGENQELEDIINLLNQPEEEIIDLSQSTDAFEGLSQEELDMLMQQDEEISIDDMETDVVNDISVYDNKETDEKEVIEKLESIKEYEENNNIQEEQSLHTDALEEDEEAQGLDEKSKTKLDKHTVIIFSSIIFLTILIIITIIFFTIAIKRANNIAIQEEIKKDNLISKYTPEDENTVYFDMAKNINGETLILEKVHINELNTTFYFKNNIDVKKYNIVLTDKNNSLYAMDLDFTNNGNDENATILRFNSIEGEIENLELIFESIETGEKAIFNLEFTAHLIKEDIKYINGDIKNNFGDYNIDINYAQFSDRFSRIDYTIEPNDNISYEIQQGALGESNYIKLKENEVYIEPLSNKPVASNIDNKIIGRMDFKNIENKDGTVVLEFKNLYRKYTINEKVSLNSVKSGNTTYKFDNYELFIEGMPNFEDTYVLVAHAEDVNTSVENRPDDFNHIEVKLDAEIIANLPNGIELIISPTEIKSARYGTDIIFKLDKQQYSMLKSTSEDNVFINIKSMLIKEDDVSIPISLSRSMQREIISHQVVEENLEKAFVSRLEGNPSGFSNEVLNDEMLKNQYNSLQQGKKKNTISILSKNIEDTYIEAIVREAIQIEDKGNIKVVYMTHKIKASYIEDKWVIDYDEIIK